MVGDDRRADGDDWGQVNSADARRRLVVGITGASATIVGIKLLEVLREIPVEVHLVLTDAGAQVAELEMGLHREDIEGLADVAYGNLDLGSAISSGSFKTMGMVIAPCSIRSLSGVVNCNDSSLLVRAADVTLKEGRKLVLAVRETPLHLGHLRLMTKAAEQGAVILPPMLGMYYRPRTVEDVAAQIAGKLLDQFDLDHALFRRWRDCEPAGGSLQLRKDYGAE
jgi:flavin prenyltransferase